MSDEESKNEEMQSRLYQRQAESNHGLLEYTI